MAPRRSTASRATATSAATASSARYGTRWRGWTAARAAGRSRLAAMAKRVRLSPACSDSSTPSEATAAPTRTTGSRAARRPAATASARGAVEAASAAAQASATYNNETSPYLLRQSSNLRLSPSYSVISLCHTASSDFDLPYLLVESALSYPRELSVFVL